MKTCPFCAEHIQDAAIVCPHCRRQQPIAGSAFGWTRRGRVLILSALVVLGVASACLLQVQRSFARITNDRAQPPYMTSEDYRKRQIYDDEMATKDRAVVAGRHHITKAELDAIMDEGDRRGWDAKR